jgi:hypothetical protein
MKITNWVFLFSITLFMGCNADNQPSANSEKTVEEIKQEGPIKNSDIIRNPVSANEPLDTINVAKIQFEEAEYNFGEVYEGEVVEHVFRFTNVGKAPLIINSARSTCGCTVPEWPKDPIPPGESGELSVRFNTKGKRNRQTKPVTVNANTYPASSKVFIKGFVHSEDDGHDHSSHDGHSH